MGFLFCAQMAPVPCGLQAQLGKVLGMVVMGVRRTGRQG